MMGCVCEICDQFAALFGIVAVKIYLKMALLFDGVCWGEKRDRGVGVGLGLEIGIDGGWIKR